ncbi:hypothetical protein CYYG_00045 [Cyanophage SS120-1]|uniref:Uncharacterized protein n=1 Tax=Cyanophage SS120-1 TaxID=616674 RepID=M1UAE0_9CAUD|nr:hypothetical protein CYYG_00045 [Cyanophage SS120-1]AGG54546.1 hypothetical protein CYYG_00045 [Cyanophage SS120-1]
MPNPLSLYDFLGQAIQFRVANDQPVGCANEDQLMLQRELIREEYWEFRTALDIYGYNKYNDHECLKELADLVYVCFQYAVAAGWELDEALDRVHKSNMSKLVNGKPLKDENGKVQKGPNYQPPFLEDLA